jgi:hypothetical protein
MIIVSQSKAEILFSFITAVFYPGPRNASPGDGIAAAYAANSIMRDPVARHKNKRDVLPF